MVIFRSRKAYSAVNILSYNPRYSLIVIRSILLILSITIQSILLILSKTIP